MMHISSTDNRIVKLAASLSDKKYRDRECAYLLEGVKMLREALENRGKARVIFIRAESASAEARELARQADAQGLAVYEVSEAVFAKISQTETPQGILAVMEKPVISHDEFFRLCGDKDILVLDRVQDPGNIGTLLRSAEAAGFGGAVFIKGSGDPFSSKAVRAASGAAERLPMIFAESADAALALLRLAGKRIFATAMEAQRLYYDADISRNAAIVVGNEGSGASQAMLDGADEVISIAMDGKAESLNAAVAAGIIMFEARRQRNDR